ncbi:condensation domain-containing protein, partial [Amycolatopsis cihanbeyliensis]
TVEGASHPFTIPAGLAERLSATARANGATPFAVLLAGLAVLLARRGAGDDLVIGAPTTHRPFTELERTVGMFVTTTALRVDLSGDPTGTELLGRARATAIDALGNAEVSFDEVTGRVAPRRDLSHHPLFQVMLVLNQGEGSGEWAGFPARAVPVDRGTSRFDLTLHVRETGGDWPATLDYSTDLFEPETVARIAEHLLAVLTAILDRPDARLSTLDALGGTDRAVAAAVNGAEPPPAPGVLTRIAAQDPAAPAVVSLADGTTVTFGELDRRANGIAHLLAGLGVGPETPVGVALPAGPEA